MILIIVFVRIRSETRTQLGNANRVIYRLFRKALKASFMQSISLFGLHCYKTARIRVHALIISGCRVRAAWLPWQQQQTKNANKRRRDFVLAHVFVLFSVAKPPEPIKNNDARLNKRNPRRLSRFSRTEKPQLRKFCNATCDYYYREITLRFFLV